MISVRVQFRWSNATRLTDGAMPVRSELQVKRFWSALLHVSAHGHVLEFLAVEEDRRAGAEAASLLDIQSLDLFLLQRELAHIDRLVWEIDDHIFCLRLWRAPGLGSGAVNNKDDQPAQRGVSLGKCRRHLRVAIAKEGIVRIDHGEVVLTLIEHWIFAARRDDNVFDAIAIEIAVSGTHA